MKKLTIVIILISLMGCGIVSAAQEYTIYLPLIEFEREFVIDCMDGDGNFIPCP